jgi:DNA-binding NarL/FixJ family response regulator
MHLTDSGWDDLLNLHNKAPDVPILVIADFEANEQIRKAIFIGANGCVSTNFTWRTVTSVIQRILDGEIVSPPINYNIEKTTRLKPPSASQPIKPNVSTDNPPANKLTPRQQQVLKLIQSGQSNKEIARKLDMAVPTVKIHCAAIYRELGVKNRTQAAMDAEKYLSL